MSFTAVHKHVAVLERAGLIAKRRQGREASTMGNVTAVRSLASIETTSPWATPPRRLGIAKLCSNSAAQLRIARSSSVPVLTNAM